MVKSDFRLFIKLLLSLFYVAYTTHKIVIFMNHLKLIEITSKIMFLNTFKGTIIFVFEKFLNNAFHNIKG